MKLAKKIKILICALFAFFMIFLISLFFLFADKIETLQSLKKIDEGFYFLEYKSDYKLENFLKNGIADDGELLSHIIRNTAMGIALPLDVPEGLSCSSFKAKTPDGAYIMGRNMDLMNAPVLLLKTEPASGYKSLSFLSLNLLNYSDESPPADFSTRLNLLASPLLPFDGINEKGLAVSILMSGKPTKQDTGKKPITTTLAVRMLLDKAANVNEALVLLNQYDMRSSANTGYHFFIADRAGNSAIVEYLENEIKISDGKILTNFLVCETTANACGRYKLMEKTLDAKKDILNEPDAMNLLHGVSTKYFNIGVLTQWSAVYNLQKNSVYTTIRYNFDKPHFFSLEQGLTNF